ncbi:MAG: hypothetical protein OSJ43_17390 [Oscillospiraceae bacterium]|nr:hypothetical protein [Oscillospiraceae bacterium]
MKTLEFYVTDNFSVAGLKPLMDRLAKELGDEWQYAFDAEAKTARFTHGVMFFEFTPTSNSAAISINCGNGKVKYTALNSAWGGSGNKYYYIDILEAEDCGTVVLGFRTANDASYGFNVIWGKYDDGSEYIIWGTIATSSSETPATLLDDTATASRNFSNVLESIGAPWCFGKLPKTNLAALPTSLYFGSSVPYRTRYIELLRGDKKFVGFAAFKAGSNNAITSRPSMFAVPVETFDVEYIKI